MDSTHTIKRLELNIKGQVPLDIQQAIREMIPAVLAFYFDKFAGSKGDILIDKIAFNLGSIHSDNFIEEFRIRLSYLLETELQKFFDQPDIYQKLEEKALMSRADAFVLYAEKGYSTLDQVSLNDLFKHLLTTDIALLRQLMSRMQASSQSMQRIFYQVSFQHLEQYWLKTEPTTYKKIQSVVDLILSDTGYSFTKTHEKGSIVDFLKRMIFDYMVQPISPDQAARGFIALLQTHVDSLKEYEHELKTSAFQYLHLLNTQAANWSDTTLVQEVKKESENEAFLNYISTGKPDKKYKNFISKNKKAENEWKELIHTFIQSQKPTNQSLQRFISLLPKELLPYFINQLHTTRNALQNEQISKVIYFRFLIKELFGEDIYLLNPRDTYKLLVASSSGKNSLKNQIQFYLELISAKKQHDYSTLLASVEARAGKSVHNESKAIQHMAQQLRKEFEQNKSSEPQLPRDFMGAYLYFLKYGLWVLPEHDPQFVLKELLLNNKELLIAQLKQHFTSQIIWIRIIYQHSIADSRTLFRLVFDAAHFQLVEERLSQLEKEKSSNLRQRKLLETFIHAVFIKQENPTQPFEDIFLNMVQDLNQETRISSSETNSSFTENAFESIYQLLKEGVSPSKLSKEQKSRLISTLVAKPHQVYALIHDPSIEAANWEAFLKLFDKADLFDLLMLTARLKSSQIAWMPSLLYFIEKQAVKNLFTKPALLSLISQLISHAEDSKQAFLSLVSHLIKEKDKRLAEELISLIPFADADKRSTPLAISEIQLTGWKDSKTIAQAIDDISLIVKSLESKGFAIAQSVIYQLLIDILPSSKSNEALKAAFIAKVKEVFPSFKSEVEALEGNVKEVVSESTSFAQMLLNSIETGKIPYEAHFKSKLDFERYLLQSYSLTEEVQNIFQNANPSKVLSLIRQFNTNSIQQLDYLVQQRFTHSEYVALRERLMSQWPELSPKILSSAVAYGLTVRSFNALDFLEFSQQTATEGKTYAFILDEKPEVLSEVLSPKLYVEGLIHYLKYDVHLYASFEQDGIDMAIQKVFTYYADTLLHQLRAEPRLLTVAEKLFSFITTPKQITLFSSLLGLREEFVASILQEVKGKTKANQNTVLAHWLASSISNQTFRGASSLIEIVEAAIKDSSSKTLSIEKVDYTVQIDKSLPKSLLSKDIEKFEREDFTPEKLLRELAQTGQIPTWLNSPTRNKIGQLLIELAKQSPLEFKKLLENSLKEKRNVLNLQQLVGSDTLLSIIKISDSATHYLLSETVKELLSLHKSFGSVESLYDYFLGTYLVYHYENIPVANSEEQVLESVIERFILDFGVSITDYQTLLKKSKSAIARTYLKRTGKAERALLGEVSDTSYRINLLIYIATENQMPWWAKLDPALASKTLDSQFSELLSDLLEKKPEELVKKILETRNKQKVLRRVISPLQTDQLQKIILILSPNFGGFIISYTLLVHRAQLTMDQKNNYAHIIGYLANSKTFTPSDFIWDAIRFLSSQVNKPQPKLIAQLHALVSAAIQEGEMRFLPFVDILKTKAVEKEPSKTKMEELISPEARYNEVELLIQLAYANSAPSWATEYTELSEKQVIQEIKRLGEKLLLERPKELTQALLSHTAQARILHRLTKHIAFEKFYGAILALSPNLGGFITSFSHVVQQSKLSIDKADWLDFVFQFLNEKSNPEASDFVRKSMVFLTQNLSSPALTLKEKLLKAARKSAQKEEKRYALILELLSEFASNPEFREDDSSRQKPKMEKVDSPPVYNFIHSVVYYLHTGAIPANTHLRIHSYAEFLQALERHIVLERSELRLAISKALIQAKVRKRVIKEESEHFIYTLVRVLFPREANELFVSQAKIIPLLKEKWSISREARIREMLYLQLFEQEIEKHLGAFHVANFIASFIQLTSAQLNKPIVFDQAELEGIQLDDKIIRLLLKNEESKEQKPTAKKEPLKLPERQANENTLVDHRVLIRNAGVVMVWPFLSRYFTMLDMLENRKFKSEKEAIRAVHLIQFIASGSTSAPEHELLLNKVLCGLPVATPVPLEVELSQKEIETTEMMLKGVLQNWERIKSSSTEALREGFLTRDGYMLEKEKVWELKVEKKTLDILMKDLPWAIGTIKLPWMEKRLLVEWL